MQSCQLAWRTAQRQPGTLVGAREGHQGPGPLPTEKPVVMCRQELISLLRSRFCFWTGKNARNLTRRSNLEMVSSPCKKKEHVSMYKSGIGDKLEGNKSAKRLHFQVRLPILHLLSLLLQLLAPSELSSSSSSSSDESDGVLSSNSCRSFCPSAFPSCPFSTCDRHHPCHYHGPRVVDPHHHRAFEP